jgi:hypothetical protein
VSFPQKYPLSRGPSGGGARSKRRVAVPEWSFRAMQRGELNVDPIQSEFFSTEAIDGLTEALVRESIQNTSMLFPLFLCFPS